MKIEKTDIEGLLVILPKIFEDNRGWFSETYNKKMLLDLGINLDFVQDNHSLSTQRGVLRGIHLQNEPKAQTKLVRCTRGAILDVAVDLRENSNTYKKWFAVELTAENKKQLLIPKGFGHGFVTLTDNVEVQYKVDELYSKEHERTIKWNDPDLGILWNVENPILSEKDKDAYSFKEWSQEKSNKVKVLITGSKGFIGKNLKAEILREFPNAEILTFDRGQNKSDLEKMITSDLNVIFHLAGEVRPESSNEEFMKSNLDLTTNIIDILEKGKYNVPILMTSTIHAVNPTNYYGKTKKIAEDRIISYGNINGVNNYIYRLPHVFGEGCKPNHNSVISTWIVNSILDKNIDVYDRSIKMRYVYVKDVVNDFISVAFGDRKDIFYNIDPVYETTLGEVVDLISVFKLSLENGFYNNITFNNGFSKKLYSTYVDYYKFLKGGLLD